jgi:predicted dehydrogenase
MEPVRWGIMGTAAIARQAMIPAIQGSRNGRVVAIASRTAEQARDVAARFGIATAHGSYDALIADKDIEAVYIPLPNHLHVPWSIKAADAGKHVLCEKPIAVTADEVPDLIAARERNRVLIAEAFMVRHHPQWRRARDLVRAGRIGRLRAVHADFCEINSDPLNIVNRLETGGGALRDLGCYPLMFARYLFGREPRRVAARSERHPATAVDVAISGLLDFGEGEAAIHCSTTTAAFQRVVALGDRGRIEIAEPIIMLADKAAEIVIDDGTIASERFEPRDHYRLQAEAFADAIRAGTPWEFPIEDALANMRAIDAIFRAADSGRWEAVA